MGYETKLAKNFTPIEHRRLGLGILAGLVLTLTYLSPSIFYSFPFTNVNLIRSSSMNAMSNDSTIISQTSVPGNANVTVENMLKCNGSDVSEELCEKGHSFSISRDQVANASALGKLDANSTILGNNTESSEGITILQELKLNASKIDDDELVSMNSSSTIQADSSLKEITVTSTLKSGENVENMKPLCDFSNRRSNICDMQGDVRIHGKSSSVVSFTSSEIHLQRNESWQIRPYARKTNLNAMSGVRELTVRSSINGEDSLRCTLNHSVPAVVFSIAGYTGNFFHDFSDVLVPLFLTSYQFNGEVQFLVTNFRLWWIDKYRPIITNLSKYELIDLDNDDQVHCFQRAIVGLDSHDDLRIDTWRSPNGYSMVDSTKFLRAAYSLPRGSPLTPEKHFHAKPRLLIVARSQTRRFTNLNDIVRMAKRSGYEVIVAEAEWNVTHFARIVNSCDVMMGVHGAGLTNFVFLPTNAVLIQVVPWGRLDWIARTYFDVPSKGMNLRYLEYKIGLDESTLTDMYPRDDPVLTDPVASVHQFGWDCVRETYLVKQNVRLNVKRFRPVLLKALKLLHEK